ncbi:MAG: histidine kinase [Microbacteriaceae bacterium]|nr:histidine kinase [Microbacteriaceae bacterium]
MKNYDTGWAPAYSPEAAGQSLPQRAIAQGLWFLLPNVLFLGVPLIFVAQDLTPETILVYLGLLVSIAVLFIGAVIGVEWRIIQRITWFSLLTAATVLAAIVGGGVAGIGYFAPYVCSVAAMFFAAKWVRIFISVYVISCGVLAITGAVPVAAIVAFAGGVLGFTLTSEFQRAAGERKMQELREQVAVLAVASERERIGRDLHDILGHSLTAIAIKTDLAEKLVSRDASAAQAEIADISRIARAALADVRATAAGLREVRLASEIAAARAILEAAGITVTAPSALPVFNDESSEVLGFCVREAVTNVMRHSGATACEIGVSEHLLTVADNGSGIVEGASFSGLQGLRERCECAGWQLSVENNPGNVGVRLSVTRLETGENSAVAAQKLYDTREAKNISDIYCAAQQKETK